MTTTFELAHRAARSRGSRLLGCGVDDLERFRALCVAEEREACAQVCEDGVAIDPDWDSNYWDQACMSRALAIRARGTL